jgi:hypothetical protein
MLKVAGAGAFYTKTNTTDSRVLTLVMDRPHVALPITPKPFSCSPPQNLENLAHYYISLQGAHINRTQRAYCDHVLRFYSYPNNM